MKKLARRNRALRTTALGLVLFATACAQDTAPNPAIDASIDRAASAWVESGKAVGVVVEVAQAGHVLFARGYGKASLASPEPITPHTQFRIGSLTKQFTAAAILQLVGQSKIALDERLSRFFPDFPRANEVTIRQMLTHSSGIHSYTEFEFSPENFAPFTQDHTTRDWVDHIAQQKPLYDFPPGSAWHYDNSGYFLLGAIVEQVSGQSLSGYFHDHLFQPLGMTDTAIDGNSDAGPDRAAGYEHDDEHPGTFQPAVAISMTVPGGAGALRSSARDLVTWNDALFQGRVVNPDLLKIMTTPARLNDGRLASANRVNMDAAEPQGEYGFGLRIGTLDGHREIGHEGDIFGFNAVLDSYPDDDALTIVVLANTPAGAVALEKQIAAICLTPTPR